MPAEDQSILVLNAGSSSIKFSLFASADLTRRCCGQIEGIGGGSPRFRAVTAYGATLVDTALRTPALATLLDWLEHQPGARVLGAVGHRVVHGGAQFLAPVRIDAQTLAQLEALVPLAPLHQPHNLAAIRALAARKPGILQVACFDTAFHRSQPELAQRFALPRELHEAGIRRYGFHGLSYEYIASVLPSIAGPTVARGRVVVAHLGNGASLCALRQGQSIATTMGFTALDGLVMGTRAGALDPGVILYLMQSQGLNSAAVADLLYHRCGLLGVSGSSSDMRALLASTDPHAEEAIALFVYRIGRELGSLTAALGGLDALVFTGGIGEHAAPIRARVCRDAAWLGVQLDEAANARAGPCISAPTSAASAWVVPTDEEYMIARHTLNTLKVSP